MCAVGIAATASAQGLYPGNPAKYAYTLPAGFEPVLQFRTYYFDQESLTGVPSDKDGTRLLAKGQEPIAVLGEAFAAVRFRQTATAYRQLINRPFINPQDGSPQTGTQLRAYLNYAARF